MIKRMLISAILLLLPISLARAQEPSAKNLTDILVQKDNTSVQITVVADGTIGKHTSFTLDTPSRLVLDLMGIGSAYPGNEIPVNHPFLEKIRIGLSQEKVRLVLDIPQKQIPAHTIAEQGKSLLLVLGKPAKTLEKEPAPIKAPAPLEPTAVKKEPEPMKTIPPPAPPREVTKVPEKKAVPPSPEKKVVEKKPALVTTTPPLLLEKEVKKAPEKKAPLPSSETTVPEIVEKKAVPPKGETGTIPKTAVEKGLTGREIAERVYNRDDGQDSFTRGEMVLIDKREKQRVRELTLQEKDYGALTKTLIRFTKPDDIAGTGFLSYENEDRDDDQFLFLPELRRVRRVVSSQKDKSFVNTDFTYEDLERRKVDDDEHRLLREEIVDGKPCYVVESVSKRKKSQYSKLVSWVIKDIFFPIKVEYYKKAAQPAKVLTNKKIENVDGIWTAMEAEMSDLEEGHRTITRITEVQYNRGISDDVFTARNLEKY